MSGGQTPWQGPLRGHIGGESMSPSASSNTERPQARQQQQHQQQHIQQHHHPHHQQQQGHQEHQQHQSQGPFGSFGTGQGYGYGPPAAPSSQPPWGITQTPWPSFSPQPPGPSSESFLAPGWNPDPIVRPNDPPLETPGDTSRALPSGQGQTLPLATREFLREKLVQIYVPLVWDLARSHQMGRTVAAFQRVCDYMFQVIQSHNDSSDIFGDEDYVPFGNAIRRMVGDLESLTRIANHLYEGSSVNLGVATVIYLLSQLVRGETSVGAGSEDSQISHEEAQEPSDRQNELAMYLEQLETRRCDVEEGELPMDESFCPLCLKKLGNKEGRNRHIDKFDPRRLFRCDAAESCAKRFHTRLDNLKKHYRGLKTERERLTRPKHSLTEQDAERLCQNPPAYEGTKDRQCVFCQIVFPNRRWGWFWDEHVPACRRRHYRSGDEGLLGRSRGVEQSRIGRGGGGAAASAAAIAGQRQGEGSFYAGAGSTGGSAGAGSGSAAGMSTIPTSDRSMGRSHASASRIRSHGSAGHRSISTMFMGSSDSIMSVDEIPQMVKDVELDLIGSRFQGDEHNLSQLERRAKQMPALSR